MNKIAVVYHSAHGHTENIAEHIVRSALAVPSKAGRLIEAERKAEFGVHRVLAAVWRQAKE